MVRRGNSLKHPGGARSTVRKSQGTRTTDPHRRTLSPGSDELGPVFDLVARYFGLLSDATRLKILHSICRCEQSVSAIVAETGLSQSTVSRQLGMLYHAGVVDRRRAANVVHYRVVDPVFVDICRTVCVQIAGRIDGRQPLRDDLLAFAATH